MDVVFSTLNIFNYFLFYIEIGGEKVQVNVEKSSKNYRIQIPNKWFSVDSGTPYSAIYGEKGLLLLIRMLQQLTMRYKYSLTYCHIKEWFQYNDARSIKTIFKILNRFKQDGVFIFDRDYDFTRINKELILYKPSPTFLPRLDYFSLYDYEVDTILKDCRANIDKYKLLSLFACLKFYYHTKAKICSPSLDTLAAKTNLSINTIQSYLDILVDLRLILYENPGTKLFPNGEVKECNNIYTMNYKDNDKILKQEVARIKKELVKQEKQKELKIINNKIGRLKTSIKMKMYWLRIRLERGVITQSEHDTQIYKLQAEYDELIKEQELQHEL